MRKIESFVYLQIIDQAWKEHLLAMDALKDSVRLRGYGQRDPLQEYKKEAFNLFALLVSRIEDETTLTLLKMPTPQPSEVSSFLENKSVEEESYDESLEFAHPDPQKLPPASQSSAPSESEQDKLVYYGSHAQQTPNTPNKTQINQQPVKREGSKVGRNDLCPCGSGKKFKKCHGN